MALHLDDHPILNGNKRVTLVAMLVHLDSNGYARKRLAAPLQPALTTTHVYHVVVMLPRLGAVLSTRAAPDRSCILARLLPAITAGMRLFSSP